MNEQITCDIFCSVVDNYGDIGVCWRLARQLANEHDVAVRLWVDNLARLEHLCPEVDVNQLQQVCRGVDVRFWAAQFPEVQLAHLVIESFACELPQRYIDTMADQEIKPLWINLEYLSAEDWVDECHGLPSPHPRLPLIKYFFFPGFTPKTGGLILEHDLFQRRDAFQNNWLATDSYWRSLGVATPLPEEMRVSLFSYENPEIQTLLQAWEKGSQVVTCLVPQGRSLVQVAEYFGVSEVNVGDSWSRGNLNIHVLPFVEQERYDELLWACDINFVRGEDSFVRAQWAGRPFVWHIYPQHDGVHMKKLHAFLERYGTGLVPEAAEATRRFWQCWNGEGDVATAWNEFLKHQSTLRQHSRMWAQQLSGNNLALNLLDFLEEVGKMRDFEN